MADEDNLLGTVPVEKLVAVNIVEMGGSVDPAERTLIMSHANSGGRSPADAKYDRGKRPHSTSARSNTNRQGSGRNTSTTLAHMMRGGGGGNVDESEHSRQQHGRSRGRSSANNGDKKMYEGGRTPSSQPRQSSTSSGQQQTSNNNKPKRTRASERMAAKSSAPWSEVRRKSREGVAALRRLSMTRSGTSVDDKHKSDDEKDLERLREQMKKKRTSASKSKSRGGDGGSTLRSSAESRSSAQEELARLREERKKGQQDTTKTTTNTTYNNRKSSDKGSVISSTSEQITSDVDTPPTNRKVIHRSKSQEKVIHRSKSQEKVIHRSSSKEKIGSSSRVVPRRGELQRQLSASLGAAAADSYRSSSQEKIKSSPGSSNRARSSSQEDVKMNKSHSQEENNINIPPRRSSQENARRKFSRRVSSSMNNVMMDHETKAAAERRKSKELLDQSANDDLDLSSLLKEGSGNANLDKYLGLEKSDTKRKGKGYNPRGNRHNKASSVDESEEDGEDEKKKHERPSARSNPKRMERRYSNSMGAATMSKAIDDSNKPSVNLNAKSSATNRREMMTNRRGSLDSSVANLCQKDIKEFSTVTATATRRGNTEKRRNSLESSLKLGEGRAKKLAALGEDESSSSRARKARSRSAERKDKSSDKNARRRSISHDVGANNSKDMFDTLVKDKALDSDLAKIDHAFKDKQSKDKLSSSPQDEKAKVKDSKRKNVSKKDASSSERRGSAIKSSQDISSSERRGSAIKSSLKDEEKKLRSSQEKVPSSSERRNSATKKQDASVESSPKDKSTALKRAHFDVDEHVKNISDDKRRNSTMTSMPNKERTSSSDGRRRHTALAASAPASGQRRDTRRRRPTVMMRSVINRMTNSKGLATLTPEQVDAVFDEFDADKSGEIDHIEFRRALHKMGMQKVPKADIDVMIRSTDTNNDGVIDRAEFHTMVNKLRQEANKRYQNSRHGGRPPASLVVEDNESDENDKSERASGSSSPIPREEEEEDDDHYQKKESSSCCCGIPPLTCCTLCLCYLLSIVAFAAVGFFVHRYLFAPNETSSSSSQPNWEDLWPFFQNVDNETLASFGGLPPINSDLSSSQKPTPSLTSAEGQLVTKQAGSTAVPSLSYAPSYIPSTMPSFEPSTSHPSSYPSAILTFSPSDYPSTTPTESPTKSYQPTVSPSSTPSVSPTGIPGCPDQLTRSVSLGDDNLLKLNYDIVEYQGDFGTQNGGGLLCAMLDYTGSAGWLGVAFSEAFRNPEFGRKEAIIGLPGMVTFEAVADSAGSVSLGQQLGGPIQGFSFTNPAKYEIPAGGIGDDAYSGPSLSYLSSSEKQTLVNGQTILVDQDGTTHTQMYFAKVLEEPDEVAIDPYAYTLLLYTVAPWDSSTGEYDHNPDWSSTTVNFLGSSMKSGYVRKRQREHNIID